MLEPARIGRRQRQRAHIARRIEVERQVVIVEILALCQTQPKAAYSARAQIPSTSASARSAAEGRYHRTRERHAARPERRCQNNIDHTCVLMLYNHRAA